MRRSLAPSLLRPTTERRSLPVQNKLEAGTPQRPLQKQRDPAPPLTISSCSTISSPPISQTPTSYAERSSAPRTTKDLGSKGQIVLDKSLTVESGPIRTVDDGDPSTIKQSSKEKEAQCEKVLVTDGAESDIMANKTNKLNVLGKTIIDDSQRMNHSLEGERDTAEKQESLKKQRMLHNESSLENATSLPDHDEQLSHMEKLGNRDVATKECNIEANDLQVSSHMRILVVLCNQTLKQTRVLQEVIARFRSEKADVVMPICRRVSVHPDLVGDGPTMESLQKLDCGKIQVLSKLSLTDSIVVVDNKEAADVLSNRGFQILLFANVTKASLPAKSNLVLFDVYNRDDISYVLSVAEAVSSVYILVTNGTIDELDFLTALGQTDCSQDIVSTSSHLVKSMEDMKRRWRADPDEEFSSIWLKLLEDGWNAEPGGGLVDYHYCPPGITSKSSKSGKKKGTKNVDFFTSKSKALEFIKQNRPGSIQCARLEYGLYDLMLWNYLKGTALSSLEEFRDVGENDLSGAFLLKLSVH